MTTYLELARTATCANAADGQLAMSYQKRSCVAQGNAHMITQNMYTLTSHLPAILPNNHMAILVPTPHSVGESTEGDRGRQTLPRCTGLVESCAGNIPHSSRLCTAWRRISSVCEYNTVSVEKRWKPRPFQSGNSPDGIPASFPCSWCAPMVQLRSDWRMSPLISAPFFLQQLLSAASWCRHRGLGSPVVLSLQSGLWR